MEDPIQWSADEVITAIRGRRITARSYILRVLTTLNSTGSLMRS